MNTRDLIETVAKTLEVDAKQLATQMTGKSINVFLYDDEHPEGRLAAKYNARNDTIVIYYN